MSDDPSHVTERPARSVTGRQQAGRLWRLVLKELREILRDRRTIITLVVMPILIYPLLAIVFQRFLLTSIAVNEDVSYVIGVDSETAMHMLARQMQIGEAGLADKQNITSRTGSAAASKDRVAASSSTPSRDSPKKEPSPSVALVVLPDENLARRVADSTLHLAAVNRRERTDRDTTGLEIPFVWELIYRAGSPTSEAALHYVESRLQKCNEIQLNDELKRLGVVAALPAATERRPLSYSGAPIFSLAALIPLILVLMTVTGAVYPAIDLTAGERERGTLETLIAAPVPRLGLLLAKYAAVLTVALLTAVVNMVGMTITAHSTGLAASLFGGGMTFGVVVKVLLLLALFAAFFSAILLALTSYARSFKEAQAYIIPLMLLCLLPGILCLMPSLEFQGWMAVTPLVNIVMLARDLLEGSVQTSLAIAAVCSTVFYIADCHRAGGADIRHRRHSVRQSGDVVGHATTAFGAATIGHIAGGDVRAGADVPGLFPAGERLGAVAGVDYGAATRGQRPHYSGGVWRHPNRRGDDWPDPLVERSWITRSDWWSISSGCCFGICPMARSA